MQRLSNKRKLGKATGMNSPWTSQKKKRWVKDATNKRFRRKSREFAQEVKKAYNSDGELPVEPHPIGGSYYAD